MHFAYIHGKPAARRYIHKHKYTLTLYIAGVLQSLSRIWLFATLQSVAHRLLCLWGFPGKNTGVCCHFPLQVIFLDQRSNQCLLHWQGDSLPLSHQASSLILYIHIWILTLLSVLQTGYNSQRITNLSTNSRFLVSNKPSNLRLSLVQDTDFGHIPTMTKIWRRNPEPHGSKCS